MKQKTITKWSLVKWTFPYSQTILIIIGLIFIYLGLQSQEGEFLLGISSVFIIPGNSITFIIRVFDVIDQMINLSKKEKAFGFSFNEEMRRNNITAFRFESLEWYIDVRNFYHPLKRCVFIVLKKEFIQSLGKKEIIAPPSLSSRALPFFPPYRGIREMMIVTMIDGRKQKIITYENSKIIDVFETWYRRIDHKANLPSKRKRNKKVRKNR